MKVKQIKDKFIIRLEKDEKLVEELILFCQQYNIKQGLILGIGALSQVTIGYYKLATKNYHFQDFSGDLEVTSLIGNIALLKDKPMIHLHINISDESFKVYGGHLKEGVIGPNSRSSFEYD
ncbi:DNA-binding protein [Candidatus Daviesbacteria bacterium]|nr:DNA-binding protein [Candidatus Daviesbacteria bacterium]